MPLIGGGCCAIVKPKIANTISQSAATDHEYVLVRSNRAAKQRARQVVHRALTDDQRVRNITWYTREEWESRALGGANP